ncbi:cilia- and flagella-associated protein 61 isoform X1 [Hydra vulgaris]|uniref:cilia- and flagella-associated protein 61 isoform X1 n=1 Tax=Hydra vulgaris TaxID=6087 RepID=UPI001F5EE772|nr:cilia- and flagella-associated protein 61-like isoform X2 [Hydra vulgaris]
MTDILVSARRTESHDLDEILKLVNDKSREMFGRVNLAHIVEKANFSLTIIDEKQSIVGHASFYDYPNIENPDWYYWLNTNYEVAKECSPMNSLFLHYIVSRESITEQVEKEIVRTIFQAIPLLHFVIFLLPIKVNLSNSLSRIFTQINSIDGFVSDYKVTMCYRHNHFPVLHIRPARIEDHDDLKLIYDQYNNDLVNIYGHFFLSELIEAQDEENICLVADVNGTAVGFFSASTQIDTNIIKENFDLEVYENFSKKILQRKEINKKTEQLSLDSSVVITSDNAFLKKTLGSIMNMNYKHSVSSANIEQPKLNNYLQTRNPDVQTQVEYVNENVLVESVFFIQLFFIDNKYEMRSIDFLPAVFEIFKKDYLVVTIPHSVPEFPLLQCFQRIPPKCNSIFSQELYVFNRNGFFRSFRVRALTKKDLEGVTDLITNIKGSKYIIEDAIRYNKYRRDNNGTGIFAYVAEVYDQIVGLCIFRQENEIEYIRSHYNIEDYIYFSFYEADEHARLYHFVLNPIFQHYSTYFLMEALTLSKKSSLYYTLYPGNEMKIGCSLPTCINNFVPVSVRKQIVYPLQDLEENSPMSNILEEKEPYAMYHFNRKMTFEHKAVVNVRVVVVGSSDVGLSFLQSLVYRSDVLFNNLTLVSDNDVFNIYDSSDDNKFFDSFQFENFLPSQNFNQKSLSLLSLRTWVNFVYGKLKKIDREKRLIYVNNNAVPYDQLILCTGESFHCTVPTDKSINKLKNIDKHTSQVNPKQKDMQTLSGVNDQIPNGVYALNSSKDVCAIFKWLKSIPNDETIIVYGSSLEAYVCINGLVLYGWSGVNIKYVSPLTETSNLFGDTHVTQVIVKTLQKYGVETYYEYTLSRWFSSEQSANIESAVFTSKSSSQIILNCKMLLCLERKTVDYDIFKAINDSCLVFDGKLVIDLKFQTNDPNILAAGPLTKYSRRFYSDSFSHAYFNSEEIGIKLAQYFFEKLYPNIDSISKKDPDLAVHFQKPKLVYCKLLGDFSYFRVWKQFSENFCSTGRDISTGGERIEDVQNYFRLHINQYSTIDEIVCLSSQVIDKDNLKCLFGVHTSYLGNLTERFENGLITDLYSYFRQSWCLPIYHDRFTDFRCEIRDIFKISDSATSLSLEEQAKVLAHNLQLTDETRKRLLNTFVGSGYKKSIEKKLLLFLNYNKYHLPMFAEPSMF